MKFIVSFFSRLIVLYAISLIVFKLTQIELTDKLFYSIVLVYVLFDLVISFSNEVRNFKKVWGDKLWKILATIV